MRVGIVAESFLPNVNGVTNSVLRVLEHLKREGHEAMVVAPGARDFQDEIPDYLGFEIVRVPTVMVPLVDSLPIGVPTTTVAAALAEFNPDIIHLASPFVLGGAGAFAARPLGVPAVALYQTDVAGFATKYHLPMVANLAWEWTRTIHNMSEMTLAPSSSYIRELEAHGIKNVRHWGRGVDTELFNPAKRSEVLRRAWDPTGEKKIVGFIGRLAAEKSVHRLAPLVDDPSVQLVIVGDGPERDCLAETLPSAVFTTMFALGLVLISVTPSQTDLNHIIFGNLLGVSRGDLLQVAILGAIVLSVLVLKRRDFTLYAFDPTHAHAIGLNPRLLGAALLALLALTSVVALQAVGVILVVAMLIIPGATAYLLTNKFGTMLIIAPTMSAACAIVGLYCSYYLDTASGGMIVLAQGVVFGVVYLFGPHGVLRGRRYASTRTKTESVASSPSGTASAAPASRTATAPE